MNPQVRNQQAKKARIEYIQKNDIREIGNTAVVLEQSNTVASHGTKARATTYVNLAKNAADEEAKNLQRGNLTLSTRVPTSLEAAKVVDSNKPDVLVAGKKNQEIHTRRDTAEAFGVLKDTPESSNALNDTIGVVQDMTSGTKGSTGFQPHTSRKKLKSNASCSSEARQIVPNDEVQSKTLLTDVGGVPKSIPVGVKQEEKRRRESQPKISKNRGDDFKQMLPIAWNNWTANHQEESCDNPSSWSTDEEISHIQEQEWTTVQRKKKKKHGSKIGKKHGVKEENSQYGRHKGNHLNAHQKRIPVPTSFC